MVYIRWETKVTKQIEFFIEWTSTTVLIVGVALTAWNVHPLNVYVSIIGNLGWLIVALMWRKWSIITVQVVVVMIYLVGMISKTLAGA
jgi:hypothetical protein